MKIRTANEGGVIGILKSDMWGGGRGQVKFTDTIKILRLPSPPSATAASLLTSIYIKEAASSNREQAFDLETIMVKIIQVCYEPNATGNMCRKYNVHNPLSPLMISGFCSTNCLECIQKFYFLIKSIGFVQIR